MSSSVISNENDNNFSDVSSISLATEEDSNIITQCINAWKEIQHKTQEEIESKIKEYLETPIPIQGFLQINQS
ncbi:12039_t:CDS:2 [Funneliformis caledonium]|uniref:12039_t:CDS:1 n=1 Tax=Funneliformis caledonium TaxID=1117310 RepID=A0A9N8V4W5_9GLOM|nr:12039_t:CDS:2 [Funneliformis caledonium]